MKTFYLSNFKNIRMNSFSLFKAQTQRFFSNDPSKVKFKFLQLVDNKEIPVEAEIGKTIMEVGKQNNIEWGVCGGNAACATCHCIFPEEIYEKLNPQTVDEADLLDITQGLTETSRLGCQIKVSPLLEGATISIPTPTKDIYDGEKASAKATFLHN